MPRIPFVSQDLAEPPAVVDAIRKRRGGKLLNLDRMLLNSPELAAGWNVYLGAVRTKLSLPGRLREIAICAVARVNGADYEFDHHAPVLIREGGTAEQVEALRDIDSAADSQAFDAAERAVIRLTVEMTRNVKVSDATFAEARRVMGSDPAMVEMVAAIATYNMVSRFLVALGVEDEQK